MRKNRIVQGRITGFVDIWNYGSILFIFRQRQNCVPHRFLNLLRGAEYVCTDSFHGTCFSIINEKRFMIFNRYANTSATSKNSRIDSLCQNLGVSDRRFSGEISDIQKTIDYKKVYCNLAKLKQKTDQYINAAFIG